MALVVQLLPDGEPTRLKDCYAQHPRKFTPYDIQESTNPRASGQARPGRGRVAAGEQDLPGNYVARQIAVKTKYRLWVIPAERDVMDRILAACPATPLPTT